jgi:hypothetical protein
MAKGGRSGTISGEPKLGVIDYVVVARIAVVWVVGGKTTTFLTGLLIARSCTGNRSESLLSLLLETPSFIFLYG